MSEAGAATFNGYVKINGVNGLALGADTTPATFGSGVPTINFQGTADNGRGGAIQFREYAASCGDGSVTGQIYSTDGGDGYAGLVLNSEQGGLKLNTGGLSSTRLFVATSGEVLIGANYTTASTVTRVGQKLALTASGGTDRGGMSINTYIASANDGLLTLTNHGVTRRALILFCKMMTLLELFFFGVVMEMNLETRWLYQVMLMVVQLTMTCPAGCVFIPQKMGQGL